MKQTDLIIIGAGPAGCTAAIYASRSGFDCALIGGSLPGGQLLYTSTIENFPGTPNPLSGYDLIDNIHKQVKRLGVDIIRENAEKLDLGTKPYTVTLSNGESYCAPVVLIAAGANSRWLGMESEKKYRGHGVSSCATCDGFFFKGKEVCVIGGGNTALEDALFLTKFVAKVSLIHRRAEFRGDAVLAEEVKHNPKIELVLDSVPTEFTGSELLEGVKVKNEKTGAEKIIPCSGAFVAIGTIPNTALVKGQLALDENGYIKTDANCRTSLEGVYAAGDIMDPIYRQAVIAAGTGAKAAIAAGQYILSLINRCPIRP